VSKKLITIRARDSRRRVCDNWWTRRKQQSVFLLATTPIETIFSSLLTMEKKTKTVFQLDSPYTQAKWYVRCHYRLKHANLHQFIRPEVSVQDQDTILELLCR
jgi:hypothetical protein